MNQQHYISSHRTSEQRLRVISHRGACLIFQYQKVVLDGPAWTNHCEILKYYRSTSRVRAQVPENLTVKSPGARPRLLPKYSDGQGHGNPLHACQTSMAAGHHKPKMVCKCPETKASIEASIRSSFQLAMLSLHLHCRDSVEPERIIDKRRCAVALCYPYDKTCSTPSTVICVFEQGLSGTSWGRSNLLGAEDAAQEQLMAQEQKQKKGTWSEMEKAETNTSMATCIAMHQAVM